MKRSSLMRLTATKAFIIFFFLSTLAPFITPGKTRAAETNENLCKDLAARALQFTYQWYMTGKNLDEYDAYVLTLAGADVSTWVYGSETLKDSIIKSIEETIHNPAQIPAKKIAQQLLITTLWGENDLANQLLQILAERQNKNYGAFDADNEFSNIPAYEILGVAGFLNENGVINLAYAKNYLLSKQSTEEATYGAWTTTWADFMTTAQAIRALSFLPGAASDQEVQGAINKGLSWMEKQLKPDGSVFVTEPWPDDPVIDTAETILTLKTLGIDPASWQKEGKSPIDYILNNALNSDGSFGTMKNDMDAIWALYIYDHILGGKVSPETWLGVTIKPLSAAISIGDREQYTSLLQNLSGNIYDVTSDAVWTAENPDIAHYVEKGLFQALKEGQTVIRAVYSGLSGTAELIVNTTSNGTPGDCVVDIAVVDSNQELIFGPASVTVSKNNRWGLTVLGALDATGLPYTMSDKYEGLVESIAGRKNSGTAGWMYKVNNIMPALSAKDQQIKNGDKIIWWYSTDINSSGPTWDELLKRLGEKLEKTEQLIPPDIGEQNKLLPDLLQASNDALNLLETTEQKTKGEKNVLDELSGTPEAIAVSGTREPLNIPALTALKEELAGNKIDLSQKVSAEKGAVITDTKAEMALVIPAAALKTDTEISVQKKLFPSAGETGGAPVPAVPAGYRPVSPLYRLGPEGTLFDKPATLYMRIVIPPLVRPENLALAWYNGAEGCWKAVPAVVDAARGLVLARLAHFSNFAVFAKNSKKSFTDVTPDNFGWARETIETLAGAGILGGVDGARFEPERSLTRAEFASLLVKALALKENGEPGKLFSDVNASSWYAGAVAAAAGAGLLQRYGDGTFRPEQKVTREEIAAVLARVKDLKPAGEKLSFRDSAKISPWAREAVAAAAAQGLVKGFPDGTFRPDAPAARAEAAAMVYRVLASY